MRTAPDIQAERYEIEVAFEPERGFLRATSAVTLRAGAALKFVELELNRHLEIKSVTDSSSRALEFTRSDRIGSSKLAVRLAEQAAAGQPFSLIFAYEGVLPRGQLDYITKDGILLRDESRWYPAVDLSAFTENGIRITVPLRWQAISSGKLASTIQTGETITTEWRTEGAVSSRSVVAGPQSAWRCYTQKSFPPPSYGERVNIFLCPGSLPTELENRFFEGVARLLSAYRKLVAVPPQAQLRIVEGFPEARGAIGYSAPGFLVVSPGFMKYAEVPGYAAEFLPHEIAHQWFPIDVTIEKEEDGWLAESIAEYLAWRYLQANDPEAARQMVFSAMRDALEPDPVRPLSLGLKLFALEPWSVTRATLYQRGMLVFRTLETVIDRERVDRALAEYYRRFHGKSASIGDFRRICEEIAARELGWFFDYFIQGTRIPEIELRQAPSGAPGVATGEIIVRNMPPEATVRVEMRIRTAKGVVDHSVATRGEVTPFSVNVPAPPLGIELDPDARILRWTEAARRNRAQQELLRKVGPLEAARKIYDADTLCRRALALDPEDAALNQQRIRFTRGRLLLQLKLPRAQASKEFQAVLDGHSIDSVETSFFRAWARVYRARIAKDSGRLSAARAEATAGLTLLAPALDERVAWADSHGRETSAREALLQLAK